MLNTNITFNLLFYFSFQVICFYYKTFFLKYLKYKYFSKIGPIYKVHYFPKMLTTFFLSTEELLSCNFRESLNSGLVIKKTIRNSLGWGIEKSFQYI